MIDLKDAECEIKVIRRRVEEKESVNPVIASIVMDARKNPDRYIREYRIPAEGE